MLTIRHSKLTETLNYPANNVSPWPCCTTCALSKPYIHCFHYTTRLVGCWLKALVVNEFESSCVSLSSISAITALTSPLVRRYMSPYIFSTCRSHLSANRRVGSNRAPPKESLGDRIYRRCSIIAFRPLKKPSLCFRNQTHPSGNSKLPGTPRYNRCDYPFRAVAYSISITAEHIPWFLFFGGNDATSMCVPSAMN